MKTEPGLLLRRNKGESLEIFDPNKYFSLGDDPLAAIAAIGFTREVAMFGCNAYRHESLPLDMRFENHRDGWRCVLNGEEVVFAPDSIDGLKDFLLGFALATLKARSAK